MDPRAAMTPGRTRRTGGSAWQSPGLAASAHGGHERSRSRPSQDDNSNLGPQIPTPNYQLPNPVSVASQTWELEVGYWELTGSLQRSSQTDTCPNLDLTSGNRRRRVGGSDLG